MIGAQAPVALTTTLVADAGRVAPVRAIAVAHARSTSPVSSRRSIALDGAADEDLRAALDRVDRVGDAEPRAVDAPLVEA